MTLTLYKTLKFDCSECRGEGFLYWGNAEDYHVESCECVAQEQLFTTQEAN